MTQPRAGSARRRGLALPGALLALTVILLFIAGSAFATTQEARASVGVLAQRVALEAAEYGAAAVLRDWDRAWNTGTPIGQTITVSHALPGGAGALVRLTRTSSTTWWVVSEGSAGGGAIRRAARRTVNAVFRLELPPGDVEAALSAGDSVHVVGSGRVIGADSVEVLPGCDATAAGVAGVASPDTTRTCDGACGTGGGRIAGLPRLFADSLVGGRVAALSVGTSPTFVLAGGTVVTPSPGVTAGSCDTLAAMNWGDPDGGPCGTWFPTVLVTGDVTIRGGRAQGVLIVTGDVTVENGASLAGIVIAGDDITFGAGGATILGAALAGDARRGAGDHTVVADGGVVRRSTCRVVRARLAAARPVRVRERWWAEFD